MSAEYFTSSATTHDPSDLSVSVALESLQRNPGAQVSAAAWQRVQEHLPNLRRFIEGASHQLSPNDPDTRGTIAASMVHVVELLMGAGEQSQIDAQWHEIVGNIEATSTATPTVQPAADALPTATPTP